MIDIEMFKSFLLRSERLLLRPFKKSDTPELLPLFSDVERMDLYLPRPQLYMDAESLARHLRGWQDGSEHFLFSCELLATGELAALLNLDGFDTDNHQTEIGFALTEKKFAGKGLATEALQSMLEYLFEEIGLHRCWCRVMEHNAPSLALVKRLGFQLEGRQREHIYRAGEYNDLLLFGILAEEWRKRG
ncbi:MAG: GNAT family N-acetyltransferase [Clostridiaceae bacterium]|nr:GNAT family N-acetyltransferase [Clostridiaceae bacterium]